MDVEQARKMVGTEFTYHFEDGDTIRSYVKAFDPAIGLTCMSLETETRDGWKPGEVEADGTFCTNATNIKDGRTSLEMTLKKLDEIATGDVYEVPDNFGTFYGCAF